MKKMNRKKHHFSLMELVIVIGIMAGLAAVAVPAYNKFAENGKRTAAKTQIGTFCQSIELFNSEKGHYPDSLNDIVSYMRSKSIPKDPWGRDYVYNKTDDGYEVISYGKDGQPGGSDYNADISSIGE